MTIAVARAGMLSTFQDLGRHGWQHLGVPVGGAMDARAHRLANLLVGNSPDEATLEMTLVGPTLRFEANACIAACGSGLGASRNGEPMVMNRPIIVRAGDVLAFGQAVRGARSYLAVHGGFALDEALGSRSTFVRGGFGGLSGRALRKGDRIGLRRPLDAPALQALAARLWAERLYLPGPIAEPTRTRVRIVRSDIWDAFTDASHEALLTQPWLIQPESDRMGYRLAGQPLALASSGELLSEATTFGTIQVPASGQPIVLMADRQTTGGYPKIGYVASCDLPLLAQMRPGQHLRFQLVDVDEARELDAATEAAFVTLDSQLGGVREALSGHPVAAVASVPTATEG
jgi:antagonist of KipI